MDMYNTEEQPFIKPTISPEHMEPLVDLERPCRHALAFKHMNFMNKRIELSFQWVSNEPILRGLYNLGNDPNYMCFKNHFYYYCRKLDIPHNNAIAFWDALYKQTQDENPLLPQILCTLIAGVTSSYGDLFQYAQMHRLPKGFVLSEDILKLEPGYTFAVLGSVPKEVITLMAMFQIRQKGVFCYNTLESEKSILNFASFGESWDKQIQAAQLYSSWKSHYATHEQNLQRIPDDIVDRNQIVPLARLFKQYISLLNEYSNSKHSDFLDYWGGFERGEEGSLPYVLQSMLHLVKENADLEQIAPIYIAKVFQTKARAIYSSDPLYAERIVQLSTTKLFEYSKPTLIENAVSNQKVPRQAFSILYQMLCMYCKEKQYDYNEVLCDFLFQRSYPLIGQVRFVVTKAQTDQIESGDILPSSAFAKGKNWVHPMLQLCSKRLKQSLKFYEDSMPLFYEDDIPISTDYRNTIKKTDLSTEFIAQYRKIWVDSSGGLGAKEKADKTMIQVADLIDTQLKKFPHIYEELVAPDNSERLMSAVQCIHQQCIKVISADTYEEIMKYLYSYFLSEDFAQIKTIREICTEYQYIEGKDKRSDS